MRRATRVPVLLAGLLASLAGCNSVQPEAEDTPSTSATRPQRLEPTPWMQDLDTRPSVFPTPYSYAGSVMLPNGLTLFAANDELHGGELWASDGTEAGTRLVKELEPGLSIGPLELTDAQGTVYFVTWAAYGLEGSSLWKTDGTTAGTVVVKRLPRVENTDYDNIKDITHVQGTVYFRYNGNQLWKSDGTEAGTTLFRQLTPGGWKEPELFSALGLLFFTSISPENGHELWRTDGTEAGTTRIHQLKPDDQDFYLQHYSALGFVFFTRWSPELGYELWRTDGTEAGTVFLRDLSPGQAETSSSSLPFAPLGDAVYFVASDSRLWKTDGTQQGTVKVSDLWISTSRLVSAGNTLFFTTNSSLWKTDGTPAGTQEVRSFANTYDYYYTRLENLTFVKDTLYFTANDPASGDELWRSDGTTAGTFLVADIWPGVEGSRITGLQAWKDHVYFKAYSDANTTGLWRSDGTAANTTLLISWQVAQSWSDCTYYYYCPANFLHLPDLLLVNPIRPTSGQWEDTWRTDGTVAGTWRLGSVQTGTRGSQSRQRAFAAMDGKVFFAARDNDCNETLWRTDGTSAGTVSLTPVSESCGPMRYQSSVLRVGSTFFFVAQDSTHGQELWKSDGTRAGTSLLKDILPGSGDSRPSDFMELNGHLFFYADDSVHGRELWRSDGTEAGTVLVKDVYPGSNGSNGSSLMAVGGLLYFMAEDGTHGGELWKSDGTELGTVLVEDILPGPSGSSPGGFTALSGRLFFSADDGMHGREPWVSDGTEAGTVLVKDVHPAGDGYDAYPEFVPTVLDGVLYFTAEDGIHGGELWKSDGTEAGTVLVKDLHPGGHSFPLGLTRVSNGLVFAADDGTHGFELWRTDGTETGTVRLTDPRPGQSSGVRIWTYRPYGDHDETLPFETLALEDKGLMLFTGVDEAGGAEPWVTDGTLEGTTRLADLVPGPESSEPMSFIRLDAERVFFFAAQAAHGREPHVLSIAHLGAQPEVDLGSTTGPALAQGDTCGQSNTFAPTCGSSNAPDQVYTWTAPSSGTFTFTTAGSTYDTVLQVNDAATGASLGCNNDSNGTLQSSVSVNLTAGQTVRLAVDGSSSSCGAFTLNIQDGMNLGSALGDAVTQGDTCGKADTTMLTCGGGSAPDQSYTWTAPSSGTFTFTTTGSALNTVLQVSDPSTGAALGCNDDASGTLQSSVSVSLTAGQTVRVAVEGLNGDCGAFTLNIQGPLDCSKLFAFTGGGFHTLALEEDGTVWSWGRNEYGQLGNNTTTPSSTPVQVQGLSGATALAAGFYHSVALTDDGSVWAWGSGGYGQLGNASTGSSYTPSKVQALSGITAIAAGNYHTLALKADGTVVAWGRNTYGALGDGSTLNRSSPVPVNKLSGVIAIAAGSDHSVALTADGTVWAWGRNAYGQLGNGTPDDSLEPVPVPGLSGVIAIASGGSHTVALKVDGTLWAWGYNRYGQLGDGSTLDRFTPVRVLNVSDITTLVSGPYHVLAMQRNGTLWAWGHNGYGAVGDGSTANRSTPVQLSGMTGITSIGVGYYHSLALNQDGTLRAWGRNDNGQLGNGSTTHRTTPVRRQELPGVTALSGGGHHTVALKEDGTVWAWGRNDYGQLGDGTTLHRTTPVQLQAPLLSGVTALAAGAYHTLALKADGTVVAWGRDDFGAVGAGAPTTRRPNPVQVQGLSGVVAIAAGAFHSVALKGDGTVVAWGRDNYGQLGDDATLTDSATPVPVWDLSGVTSIASGQYHVVALKSDGTLWAWGYNNQGQLGDGTTGNRFTRVQVNAQAQGLSGVTSMAAGIFHTLALTADGNVWAWGYNAQGQLGDGSLLRRINPVPVTGLSGVTSISAGSYHSVAVKGDGTAWAWGRNNFGQLGDTTTTDRNTPELVRSSSSLGSIASGAYHTLALDAGRTVWLWGNNEYGALGEGTSTHHTTPQLVQGLSDMCAPPPPPTTKRGLTWVRDDNLIPTETCTQTRVTCASYCDGYDGDTLCTESRPLLCLRKDGCADCDPNSTGFTNGWAGGTVALTSFLVRGTDLTSRAAADALCATTFGVGFRMAEHHDGGGGWGWRASGTITPLPTPGSTHPRGSTSNEPNRFWVAINNQPGNCWD